MGFEYQVIKFNAHEHDTRIYEKISCHSSPEKAWDEMEKQEQKKNVKDAFWFDVVLRKPTSKATN